MSSSCPSDKFSSLARVHCSVYNFCHSVATYYFIRLHMRGSRKFYQSGVQHLFNDIFMMSPNPEGGGIYCFLMRIPLATASTFFVSIHYLLNQLMAFYQTCTDTLLGGGEEPRGRVDYILVTLT